MEYARSSADSLGRVTKLSSNMTPAQQKTIEWLANGEIGRSSATMAFWIAFDIKCRDQGYPLDPADFDRCLRLLEAVPEMRPHLHRMSQVSKPWAVLAARWDEIEACHLEEVGLGWSKAHSAPMTYKLMDSILRPLERLGLT